jgi:hypothetical protein
MLIACCSTPTQVADTTYMLARQLVASRVEHVRRHLRLQHRLQTSSALFACQVQPLLLSGAPQGFQGHAVQLTATCTVQTPEACQPIACCSPT